MRYRIVIATGAFLFVAQPLSATALPGPSPSAAPAATNSRAIVTSKLKPTSRPFPTFPLTKLPEEVQSNVTVCFTVKANGSVSDARVKSFHFSLAHSANKPKPEVRKTIEKLTLQVIRTWKFSPRRISGKAVATPNVCQELNFKPATYVTSVAATKATSTAYIPNPLVPMVRFYPKSPLPRGSGVKKSSVKVCFTVEADGSVTDVQVTSIKIIPKDHSQPPKPRVQRLLAGTALLAIQNWKFFPRRIKGKPVATPNLCQELHFNSWGRAYWRR